MDQESRAERSSLPRLVTGVGAARLVGVTATSIYQWDRDGDLSQVATLSDGDSFYVLYREDDVIEVNERRKERRRNRDSTPRTRRMQLISYVVENGEYDPESGTYSLDARTKTVADALKTSPCNVSRTANDLVASGLMDRPVSPNTALHGKCKLFLATAEGVEAYKNYSRDGS